MPRLPKEMKLKAKLRRIKSEEFTFLHKYEMAASKTAKRQFCNQYIGCRLNFARTTMGMTLQNIAKDMGCSYQQIAKYMNAENRISVDQLIEMTEILNISMKWVLRGLNKKGKNNDNKVN